MSITENDFPKPAPSGRLTNNDILFGEYIPPIDRLQVMSADGFEAMVTEWGNGFLVASKNYRQIKRCSGAGDMGRDVIAVFDPEKNKWDNFQCKHYDHPLAPGDIWTEIGKLCYYTHLKEYSIPRAYYFVAPQGIGPTLNLLFEKPAELKKQFIENWNDKCKSKIAKSKSIELTGDLQQHVDQLDFSIFKGYDPQQLIDEHQSTNYFAARFGGGLKKRRQSLQNTPVIPGANEMVYTNQLLEAYSDHKKVNITEIKSLDAYEDLKEHFQRQRESFYTADSLRQFSRDNLPEETDYFEDLKSEIYSGVIDVYNKQHRDGYARLVETVIQSKNLQITGGPLVNYMIVKDREGICHHLANDKKLIWVKK